MTPEMTTRRGDFDILSTPALLQSIETSAKEYLGRSVPTDWDSVGTFVELRHQGPAALGAEFTVALETTGSSGSRVPFTCTVSARTGQLAEARHDRALVEVARYVRRLARSLGDQAVADSTPSA